MAASAQALCSGTVSEPTKTAYLPLPPVFSARSSAWASPKPVAEASSKFQSAPFWPGDSCVMTMMPLLCALLSTGSSTVASFGTTPMTLTPWAMRSSMARTCSAGSALVGPTMKASTPSSAPRSLMPASMALNHGMPPILTTTPTLPVSCAAAEKADAMDKDAATAATSSFLMLSSQAAMPAPFADNLLAALSLTDLCGACTIDGATIPQLLSCRQAANKPVGWFHAGRRSGSRIGHEEKRQEKDDLRPLGPVGLLAVDGERGAQRLVAQAPDQREDRHARPQARRQPAIHGQSAGPGPAALALRPR